VLWGDAYLAAAHAAVNGATLVTFDKGFARYPMKSLILERSIVDPDDVDSPAVGSAKRKHHVEKIGVGLDVWATRVS
jgi:hypothetical protein